MEKDLIQTITRLAPTLPVLSQGEVKIVHALIALVAGQPEMAVVVALALPVESQGKVGRYLAGIGGTVQRVVTRHMGCGANTRDYFEAITVLGERLVAHAQSQN
jgi:hypothetical protein